MKVVTPSALRTAKGVLFSRQHLLRMEKANQFPKRIRLGPNSVAWIESEVDAWLAGKAAAREQA